MHMQKGLDQHARMVSLVKQVIKLAFYITVVYFEKKIYHIEFLT